MVINMNVKNILRYFPEKLTEPLKEFERAEELRIRAERPVILLDPDEHILPVTFSLHEISALVAALSSHSLYAYLEELKQGFFSIEGGIRVGVAGKVVFDGEHIKMIRDFSSINIRFPMEMTGISRPVLKYIADRDKINNTLIISAPQHGKTTLLRDLVRAISNGEGCAPQKCVVVDERSEISGSLAFDLGERTDVLLSCPKFMGMSMALRSMSPEVIFTDEIGNGKDLDSINEVINSGVAVIATAHGTSMEELCERLFFRQLLENGMMDRILLLGMSRGRGTLEQVFDKHGKALLAEPVLLRGDVC